MALVLADRVRDTTTTTGTGTVTLSGTAPTGYQNFSVVGNGNTTYYTINAGSQWEVGLGTYSSTGPTLARTTVLSSSNGGSLVNFSTGTKDVFVTYPSGESVYQDGTAIAAGTSILGAANGGTGTNTTFTAGSVVFAGASGVYTQDNANLFWDNSNDRLGISTTSPGSKLDVRGVITGGDGTIQTVISYLASAGVTGTLTNHPYVFYANNAERARIDTSGNVGIGTTSPGSKLDVVAQDAIRATGFQPFLTLRDSSDSNKGSRIQTASAITIFYNDTTGGGTYTERMRINSSGFVGIGTSAPQVGLHVSFADQSTNRVRLQNTGSGGGNFDIIGGLAGASNAGLSFFDVTNSATRMYIDSSGNVGIGTSSPANLLEVRGAVTTTFSPNVYNTVLTGTSSATSGNAGCGISFRGYTTGTSGISDLAFISGIKENTTDTNYAGALIFGTRTNGSGGGSFERMRITSAGLVGIGTSAPNHTLDVTGNVGLSSNIYMGQGFNNGNSIEIGYGRTGSNFAYIDLIGDTTYSDYGFRILRGNGGANTDSRLQHRGTGAFTLLTEEAAPITFNTSGTERARITSDGFLLVGTTAPLAANTSNEFKNTGAGSWPLTLNSNDRGLLIRNSASGSGFYAYFEYNSTLNGGSISWSGGTTAYNTTSDYRLKKIDGPITNSGAYIDALNPVQGHWRSDGARFIGLVAHEVQEVSETAVVIGEKDGELMQQMDYSSPEIIANLIAELQSLRARVAQLEGK
jgi:hypothetical protein